MKQIKFGDLKPGDIFSLVGKDMKFLKLSGWVVTAIPDEEFGEDYLNAVNLKDGTLEGFTDNDYVNKINGLNS